MIIREKRHIDTAKVRDACIEYDWYTSGDNDEYSAMFDMAYKLERSRFKDFLTGLTDIACDIFRHSDVELDGITDAEYIAYIMSVLANDCCYFTYEVEEL